MRLHHPMSTVFFILLSFNGKLTTQNVETSLPDFFPFLFLTLTFFMQSLLLSRHRRQMREMEWSGVGWDESIQCEAISHSC